MQTVTDVPQFLVVRSPLPCKGGFGVDLVGCVFQACAKKKGGILTLKLKYEESSGALFFEKVEAHE